MNDDQEVINNYLKNNPVKDNSKAWYSQCSCCSGKVTSKFMKPATVYSGLKSVYADPIEDFPKGEPERLCNQCLSKIRNTNADMSNEDHISSLFKSGSHTGYEALDNYTNNLDKDVLRSEQEYQGFSSYESLEGTSFTLKNK